jgi:uncharacterized membrane protein
VDSLHPFTVHFPLALLTTTGVLELLQRLLKDERLGTAAWWVQIGGTIGLLAAVGSGLLAKSGREFAGTAAGTIATHEQIAFAAAVVFLGLFFWRVSGKGRLPAGFAGGVYALLLAGGILLLWTGAVHGGELAHRLLRAPV